MNEQLDTLAAARPAGAPAHEGTSQAAEAAHAAPAKAGPESEQAEGNIYNKLLRHTEDAHELEYPGGHLELPYILVERDGVRVFRSAESLREDGRYTLTRSGAAVRAETGAPPLLDMSVTKHVVFLWVAAVLLCILAIGAARRNARRLVPSGLGNLVETIVVFIRDDIVIANMGEGGVKYLPYLLTTFLFILIMNLLGLIPYGSTSTGNVNVTAGLAAIAFIMIQVSAIRAQGLGHYLAHLTGGVHWALWPIMIPIEVLGLFTKAFALCIRLFANMIGGHIVIVSLIGLIFIFQVVSHRHRAYRLCGRHHVPGAVRCVPAGLYLHDADVAVHGAWYADPVA